MSENVYQQYQNCPEGKVINADTGNCVNDSSQTTAEKSCPEGKYLNVLTGRCKNIEQITTTACKEGYYRNPETGRCRKIASDNSLTPCAEGYERNPETNRCRKIRAATASDYPVEEISEGDYDSPRIFIATAAVVAIGVTIVVCIAMQFRGEIKRWLQRHLVRQKA